MRRLLRSPIFLVASVVFIDFVGFGLVIPVLPFWAEHVGANAVGVGLVLTVYALAQFICTPLLGSLSDRHGRRPVILLSLLVEVVSFALTALAGSLPFLLIARLIGGAGASNIGSAQAVVADVTPPERRARGMGAIGAAIGLGFVVGPAAGGLLARIAPAAPFWVAAGVALVNALLVYRFLPETRSQRKEPLPARAGRRAIMAEGWRHAKRRPEIARLVTINLLFTLAFSGMEAVFALFTQAGYHWTARQAEIATGYLFTYVGVIVVIMQGGLVGRLARRFGERRVLIGGLALLALGLATLPFGTRLAPLLLALAILSIGEGAVTPTASALLSFESPTEAQGAVLGLSQGVGGLGRVIGPLLAGALFTTVSAGAAFVAGALLVALALAVATARVGTVGRASPPARVSGRKRGGPAPAAATSRRQTTSARQPERADGDHPSSSATLAQRRIHAGREDTWRERDTANLD